MEEIGGRSGEINGKETEEKGGRGLGFCGLVGASHRAKKKPNFSNVIVMNDFLTETIGTQITCKQIVMEVKLLRCEAVN